MLHQRPIGLGTLRTPDAYDNFLESHSVYRKHTIRDNSSLFRVVSEQMYDIQMLHYEIRLECVRFMMKKRRVFEKYVQKDFDKYLLDLKKSKTKGTMLELRAMCHLYKRNVILYEPFRLGTVITFSDLYPDSFCVFHTPDGQYDSVFHSDYVGRVAVSQAITFKLIYKMLFRMPDVSLAVEKMLYPQTFNSSTTTEIVDHGLRLLCTNGRTFNLDVPEETNCMLDNPRNCMFHNQNEPRSISCTRQLLESQHKPFSYRVAKSLDPFIYRNVELESCNVMTNKAKINHYFVKYKLRRGTKCQVDLGDSHMMICYIQHICKKKAKCVVFVKDICKNVTVLYYQLHPLTPRHVGIDNTQEKNFIPQQLTTS